MTLRQTTSSPLLYSKVLLVVCKHEFPLIVWTTDIDVHSAYFLRVRLQNKSILCYFIIGAMNNINSELKKCTKSISFGPNMFRLIFPFLTLVESITEHDHAAELCHFMIENV